MFTANSLLLPNGTQRNLSNAYPLYAHLAVEDIPFLNHPAFSRRGVSKCLKATTDIALNTCLGAYAGEVKRIDDNDEDAWGPYQLSARDGARYYIDAQTHGNVLRFINDSRGMGSLEPNCEFFTTHEKFGGYQTVGVWTIREIKAGDELLVSYGVGYWESLEKWWKRQNPYVCEICVDEKRFDTRERLRDHVYLHNTILSKCEYCGAGYRSPDNFHAHECQSMTCDICGITYSSRNGLLTHIRLTHQKIHKHVCFVCRYVAQSSGSLEKHMRTHSGDKPFACTHYGCDYRAAQKVVLDRHVRTHTGEKPHACTHADCDYRSITTSALKYHVRSKHTGEKPYACTYVGCHYRAALKVMLTDHTMAEHTGEKPFVCTHMGCNFRSHKRVNLTNHLKTHTGEKPYACTYNGCTYRTGHRGTLKRHKKRQHKIV